MKHSKVITLLFDTENIDIQQLRTAFANETQASELTDSEWWMPEPSWTRAWFKAVGLHSFPKINSHGQTITYPTLRNSVYSGTGQQINIEHGLKPNSINPNGSPIAVGAVKEMYMPWLEDGEDELNPTSPVPVYIMASIWRKQGKEILADFKKPNLGGWKLSMECRFTEWEYWWKDQFWTADEKPEFEDKVNTVVDGSLVVQVLGGRNGTVEFQGFGLVQTPADTGAVILQAVATNCGNAIYKDGIILLDLIQEAVASENENGGIKMDKETLKLIEDSKKSAVAEALASWQSAEQAKIDNAVKEAVAAKETEHKPVVEELATLKASLEALKVEKEALASEVAQAKVEKRGRERLEALASAKVTIPQTLVERVKEKANALEDEAWQKEVEDIKAWSAVASAQPIPRTPLVPTIPNGFQPTEATASASGPFVKIADKEYGYDSLFMPAPKQA